MKKKLAVAMMLVGVYFGSFVSVRAFSPQPGTVDDPLISVSYFVQGVAPLLSRLSALESNVATVAVLTSTIQQLESRIAGLEAKVTQLERQATTPPVTPPPPAPVEVHGFVSGAAVVNVRQGAGTNFAIITTVTLNTRVQVLERGREWHRIRLADGRVGFIHATLLRIP